MGCPYWDVSDYLIRSRLSKTILHTINLGLDL